MSNVDPADLVRFWQDAGARRWFTKDPAFDEVFSDRFLDAHLSAARRHCDSWADSAEGSLALLLLLDQFPRNAFRGTAHMYATDPLARHFARAAMVVGHAAMVAPELALFFSMPFTHSEDIVDQELSVQLSSQVGHAQRSQAEHHRDVIRRFGRFPHRNAVLGRSTTAEEQVFLDGGGFAG